MRSHGRRRPSFLAAGRRSRAPLVALVTALAVVASGAVAAAAAAAPGPARADRPWTPPRVRHVFVIVLENQGYQGTFGTPKADPYLARTLPARGALLTDYYATGHESNDNYIAMVSGQGPNPQNQADCQYYDDFVGTGPTAPDGQAVGSGCVYPQSVQTVGNQLSENGLSWKAYLQDMGNDPKRESAVCGHPALNSRDGTQSAVAGDGYVTRHDPFVYFHAVIDDSRYCDAHVVPLGTAAGRLPGGTPRGTTGLATDLKRAATTPALSFIVPNVCNDGHDYPCVNQKSGPSALADIDGFLQTWVPLITRSPAFRRNGLLIVTFDESDGPQSDSSSCCGETPGPDTPLPGITGLGGGRVGAVLISPFIRPGTVSHQPYNHYSLLASIEQLFGLPRLGYAAGRRTFGRDVYTRGGGR
jgi:phospholipase C